MRVLHLGSGFRPWRHGGLVAYLEDLMEEQVHRGDEVAYFFAGREYPLIRGPRLRRWRRDGIAMLEIVNSPLFDHGRQPELELAEPRVERAFARVVDELRPDIIHVQELAGLPSSLLDVAARAHPVVMTLHDYFPLCPSFRLFDSDQRVCLRRQLDGDCRATLAADHRPPGLMFEATARFHLLPVAERVGSTRLRRRAERLAEALGWRAAAKAYAEAAREAPPGAYQRRRDVNVERLNRVDRLIAVSERVAEIYALLGVDRDRIVTRVPTLRHIESLRPRRAGGGIVTFATLGGGESVAKGSELLLDAVRSLAGSTPPERYRVLVFGHVHRDVNAALAATPGVELRGPFRPDQVNDLLEEVDVGIVPSIWEEAYGLVGPEFLAKGIPLIANSIGGINEYAREGQTAWLNRTCTADGLAALMRHVIEHPDELAELRERTLAARASLVAPVPQHAVEVDAVYREAIGARGARMPKLVA